MSSKKNGPWQNERFNSFGLLLEIEIAMGWTLKLWAIPACTCGMKEELLKQKEEIKIHQFFLGLDDTTYSIVRSSILQIDPLPSIEKVYSMITTEEQHKKISKFAENRGEL